MPDYIIKNRQDIVTMIVNARLEKGISQAELAQMIGTKRSNICRIESGAQNISLDMLLKILHALGKDMEIGLIERTDGMETNIKASIYDSYVAKGVLIAETEYAKTYEFMHQNRMYQATLIKRMANKYSVIHCQNNSIVWEQMPRMYLMTGQTVGNIKGQRKVIANAPGKINGVIRLFVISGKPSGITGLDDGIFHSFPQADLSDKYAYVMTMAEFKRYGN